MSTIRSRWIVYILLIILRFLGVYQRGYIHPDEFFQGGQELFFGHTQNYNQQQHHVTLPGNATNDYTKNKYVVKNLPWEFEPKHAVRSIVPPIFMTLLPLHLYAKVKHWLVEVNSTTTEIIHNTNGQDTKSYVQASFIESFMLWTPAMNKLSGKEILLIPRLFMTLLSILFLDVSLWVLATQSDNNKHLKSSKGERYLLETLKAGPPNEVIILALSWPCLAFGVRPFTNNLEAMVLSFLLVLVSTKNSTTNIQTTNNKARDSYTLLMIGITCSIGMFVRFTFVFFAFPIVAIFLWYRWKRKRSKLTNILHDGLMLAISFLLISCAFVWVDSQYYSWQTSLESKWWQYIAPYNAFRYNSKSTNLAEHGIHPRITHAVVNMPMLFGPLILIAYISILEEIYSIISGRHNNNKTVQESQQFTNTICKWSIIWGLLVLSCAPHQEPRFLLPVIVPLVFLHGQNMSVKQIRSTEKRLVVILKRIIRSPLLWVVFNLILYVFFGWLHQGGLIDSLLHSSSDNDQLPSVSIYYKTYMPPTFLTRRGSIARSERDSCQANDIDSVTEERACMTADSQPHQTTILDHQGSELSVLLEVLRNILPCTNEEDTEEFIHLISPPAVVLQLVESRSETSTRGMKWEEYSIIFTRDYNAHISTEDWPTLDESFLHQLKLDVYTVSCNL